MVKLNNTVIPAHAQHRNYGSIVHMIYVSEYDLIKRSFFTLFVSLRFIRKSIGIIPMLCQLLKKMG